MTLVMLALTAVSIGTLAHTSSSEALRAQQAQRDLQARWAEVSSRRVLLPVLQEQLDSRLARWRTADQDSIKKPSSAAVISIDLGDHRIVARVEDQQSLPNLNQLLTQTQHGPRRDLQSLLPDNTIQERLVPTPLHEDYASRLGAVPYESWGQLYPKARPETLSGLSPETVPLGRVTFIDVGTVQASTYRGPGLTLWGNGKLNVWTASPEALHRVLDESIGADRTAKLLDLREDYRELSARQLVQLLALPPNERAAARLALTDRSRAFAMWLAVTPMQDGVPIPGSQTRWSLIINDESGHSSYGQVRGRFWSSSLPFPGAGVVE